MITDNIKKSKRYKNISRGIEKGLNFLKNTDFSKYEEGKYEIQGDEIFFMVQKYNTKSMDEGIFEAHKKYVDIQFIYSGREKIGFTNSMPMIETKEYNEENDCVLFEGKSECISLKEGCFAIFFPEEKHMPGINFGDKSEVTKVVVKVKKDV